MFVSATVTLSNAFKRKSDTNRPFLFTLLSSFVFAVLTMIIVMDITTDIASLMAEAMDVW